MTTTTVPMNYLCPAWCTAEHSTETVEVEGHVVHVATMARSSDDTVSIDLVSLAEPGETAPAPTIDVWVEGNRALTYPATRDGILAIVGLMETVTEAARGIVKAVKS
jgi:hypothetical protein